jgi:phosphoribosylanthranilate isomerase
MVRVKICGITNLPDALAAIKAGSDALGFVFYQKSPRYISPDKAREIIRQLPQRVRKVGVFVKAQEKTIKSIAKTCALDILQFHGRESPEFCRRFKGYRIIKSFRVKGRLDLRQLRQYEVFAYLFDSFSKAKLGGTGRQFNWKLLKGLSGIKRPVFLSGGLNQQNVQKAVSTVHPMWVDVSSSVEVSPGKKDAAKVKEFIREAKRVR